MSTSSSPTAGQTAAARHPPLLIVLHWLTFAVLLAGVSAVLIREEVEGRGTRLWLLDFHRTLGLLVLGLTVLRLLGRFRHHRNVPVHSMPMHLKLLSSLGHAAIYFLLLAVPLIGWAQTSARGQTIHWFGVLPMPRLLATDLDFAETLASIHQIAAWLLLSLLALHFAAALWHHFFRRDGVLRSMLPWPAHKEQV